ncbi:MAG: hypothetical protein AB7N54_02900 [Alphaproteobacteria bacterium]
MQQADESGQPPKAPISRLRAALLYLRRRLRGAAAAAPGPVLDVGVEAPPRDTGGPLWTFWLWLIDERQPTLERPQRTPGGRSWWRLRLHLDPPAAGDGRG